MHRRIVSVTLYSLKDLPPRCRSCVYWESTQRANIGGDSPEVAIQKEQWYSNTLLQWGSCGKLLCQQDETLAYAQYGPPAYFPQAKFYAAAPVSPDAIFLSCLYVLPEIQGRGLGKILLQALEKGLFKRGFKALETFARKNSSQNPSGPVEFYLKNGFYILRDDPEYPLVRLDFKSVLSWQENLEAALESLTLPVQVKAPLPA